MVSQGANCRDRLPLDNRSRPAVVAVRAWGRPSHRRSAMRTAAPLTLTSPPSLAPSPPTLVPGNPAPSVAARLPKEVAMSRTPHTRLFHFAPMLLLAVTLALGVGARSAGASPCKLDGQACRTNQSCCGTNGHNGLCVNSAPPGKRPFGTCCTPTTCAADQCGLINDGSCPDMLNCGSCADPATCGGGGIPNVCGTSTTTTTTTTSSTTSTTGTGACLMKCPNDTNTYCQPGLADCSATCASNCSNFCNTTHSGAPCETYGCTGTCGP